MTVWTGKAVRGSQKMLFQCFLGGVSALTLHTPEAEHKNRKWCFCEKIKEMNCLIATTQQSDQTRKIIKGAEGKVQPGGRVL